jgi:tRNA-2-methylthio-N6-dimethylallyladenosine synthase
MSENPGPRRFHIETFGCQMNVNDSEKARGLLRDSGLTEAADLSAADFVFVNTCAVRARAERKLYHTLDRLRRLRARCPELLIGVGGCVAQLHGESLLQRSPEIDFLVGTHNLASLPSLIEARRRTGRGVQTALDKAADSFAVDPAVVAHTSPVRAYVTVMEGCNQVCSFCVVPRTRGTEVCRRPEAIVEEVELLVSRGYREVLLLGQTVNAYAHGDVDFPGLLERVHGVSGLERLRFTTSHPCFVDGKLARSFRSLERLCPYLHLPIQSASDRVLSSMRRGYTAAEYRAKADLMRQAVPDLALTSDVIVGYPGETEAEFEATVRLVEELRFDGLFVFAYSPRPRTIASGLPDDVTADEKSRRLQLLNEAQQSIQREKNRLRLGMEADVLVDTEEAGLVSGRTREFRIVHVEGLPRSSGWLGSTVRIRVVRAGANSLIGVPVEPGPR